MLSFQIDNNLLIKLRNLSNQLALKHDALEKINPETKRRMHQLARVSQIGASTRIENAVLTDAEIEWIDTALEQDSRPTAFVNQKQLMENKFSKDRERSLEEVSGCRDMLFLIYEQFADLFPLTESSLRGLHHELLKYYPAASPYLGGYKTVSNSVISIKAVTGEESTVFKTADPGPMTATAMRDLVSWYNHELPQNPWSVAVACEMTFRFLAIHPFQDGNGRLGRGLFLLALLQSPDKPLAGLARYMAIDRQIEKHKEEYYYVLQKCSQGVYHQDSTKYRMDLFCHYMIKMLTRALDDMDFYAARSQNIQDLPESAYKVWDCFREFPEKKLQLKDLIQILNLPRRTINYSLKLLLENDLLQKYGKGPATRYQIIF